MGAHLHTDAHERVTDKGLDGIMGGRLPGCSCVSLNIDTNILHKTPSSQYPGCKPDVSAMTTVKSIHPAFLINAFIRDILVLQMLKSFLPS